MKKREGKAFSLIELLVVIAVISILAGLLMPALDDAIGSARSIQCMSNLRQNGQVVQMYIDTYNYAPPRYGRFAGQFGNTGTSMDWPSWTFWWNALRSEASDFPVLPQYGKYKPDTVVQCPANEAKYWDSTGSWATNYVVANRWNYATAASRIDPKSMWGGDIAAKGPANFGIFHPDYGSGIWYCYYYFNSIEGFGNCHLGAGNYVFMDGHVESLWQVEAQSRQ